MGQRINARRLDGERRIELVAVSQAERLRKRRDRLWISGEVEGRGAEFHGPRRSPRRCCDAFLQIGQPPQRGPMGRRFPRLPAMDREQRHPEFIGEPALAESERLPAPHAPAEGTRRRRQGEEWVIGP